MMNQPVQWILKRPSLILFFVFFMICAFPLMVQSEENAEKSVQSPGSENACGIESCNGLDITCGPKIPEMCTAIYRLGDFCRQFAQCRIIDGDCQLVTDKQFEDCKQCVAECQPKDNPMDAFGCETKCRELYAPEKEK